MDAKEVKRKCRINGWAREVEDYHYHNIERDGKRDNTSYLKNAL